MCLRLKHLQRSYPLLSGDFDLYMEIFSFLKRHEGVYVVTNKTCFELIDSLINNRFFLERDEQGNIVTFCNFWKIDDLETVRKGDRPEDVDSGSHIFVIDCASDKGLRDMVRKLRSICKGMKGAAWFHKTIAPQNFRFFPSQKGASL